jgi:4-amino-4-deoxy-L-arabinose transferase-like glycosyltransferase
MLWACFLARLLFYSAMMPLWEGYDEWAHFAVVRQVAYGGHLLGARDAPVPRDVDESLRFAPVPWELRSLGAPSVTRDGYWQLPAEERARRESALRNMPVEWSREDGTGAQKAYEALQPPLYYWLMAPALWVFRAGPFGQVFALRVLSSLVASFVVPLVFLIGLEVWGDRRLALGSAAVVALMPGLAIDVARVGNDCLAVLLFTLLTWMMLRSSRATGGVLGLGLLTKAYFLTAVPALIVAWWSRWGKRWRLSLLLAALVSGWWYVLNLRTTGTLTGLSESVMLRGMGTGEMARRAASIHWVKAVDSILLSHLYFGGWSSLTVRSWMYHLFYLAIAVAAVGLVRAVRQPAVRCLLILYLCFWLGQLYNVVLLFISKGLEGSMGWYMYAVVGAEVVLCVTGLRGLVPERTKRWVPAIGAALFALLDVYTVHAVAIPYYTGMIRHRASGSLEALHWAAWQSVGVGGAIERLSVFVPAGILVVLWILYLSGTVGTLVSACARESDNAAQRQG